MKISEPYELDKNAFLKKESFAKTLFLTWIDICNYCELEIPSDEYFINKAFENIQYTPETSNDDNLLREENETLEQLKTENAKQIVFDKINFPNLITVLNMWSQEGPKNKQILPYFNPGLCLEFFVNFNGIHFTIYEPIMIPYTELYYQTHNTLPEWNFEDLDKFDIIETFLMLQEINN